MKKETQKILKWLFGLDRSKKRVLQITLDCLIVPITFFLAFYLRIETYDYFYSFDTYAGVLISAATIIGVYTARGLYSTFSRYVSIHTVFSIAIGSAVSCTALFSSILLFELQIPRSVPLIFAVLICVFSLGARIFIRYLGHLTINENKENVAIYGVCDASIQLMEALRESSNYRVRLFIDDHKDLDGKNLGGVTINNLDRGKQKLKRLSIETLLLVLPYDTGDTRQRLLNILSDYPLKVKTIPSISGFISGDIGITDFKDIKVEDLLGREPVQYNAELIKKNIIDKTVFVSGAGGSIGSELCRQIMDWGPKKLITLDISEFSIYQLYEELKNHPASQNIDIIPLIGSIQDRNFIKRIFKQFEIDTTYHAAAYKHVPLMEQNVMQCIANNVFGTINMVELAIETNVKNFILVSSDKAVRPTNFMGASKRLAEIICQTLPSRDTKTCFSIVRFGNVLGSSGSVVPLFKQQIASGGPITLTHKDVTRYFMTIPEAAQLVIQAGSIGDSGDVFVLDMGGSIKIFDLAKRMVALSGKKHILDSKSTPNSDEIAIVVSGLRPGEKLFEEITYDANLVGTIHPRINKAVEVKMNSKKLQAILNTAREAIDDGNHQKLYKTIESVSDGVPDIKGSVDLFLCKGKPPTNSLQPIAFPNKKLG